jgi:hypothetical protein
MAPICLFTDVLNCGVRMFGCSLVQSLVVSSVTTFDGFLPDWWDMQHKLKIWLKLRGAKAYNLLELCNTKLHFNYFFYGEIHKQ